MTFQAETWWRYLHYITRKKKICDILIQLICCILQE